MNISIIGLGYVGCVGMGCLAAKGHKVIGVDVAEDKVQLINEGKPTIVEGEIDNLIKSGYDRGLVSATNDIEEAVVNTDITFICVGTPSGSDGHLNLEYIFQAAHQIGHALRQKGTFHIIVIRSTVFPGTNDKVSDIIEKDSSKKRGTDFSVVSNPEFLREGTAVKDYNNPPLNIIGCECPKATKQMKLLYADNGAAIEVVPIKVAEMMKYVSNTYHALKVVFGNEIGRICKVLGVDSHEVMRLFCEDKVLNISPYYFKPGFAFGGSCLPKDLKGLCTLARDLNVEVPVIDSISYSNQIHLDSAISRIKSFDSRRIGILGLSFKAGTDDLRNSPIVEVIRRLEKDGYDIAIYDSNVTASMQMGDNRTRITGFLPGIENLLKDNISDVTEWAELVVVTNKNPEFGHIQLRRDQRVYDLARIKELECENGYDGLCW